MSLLSWLFGAKKKSAPNIIVRTTSRKAQTHLSLEDLMVDRNIEGMTLEKSGDVEKAVDLYEANLKDRFDGSHPYDRLRIIYSRSNQYDDAIRVCQAYIDYGQIDTKGKEKFATWILKYQSKKE